jgi:excisionase family DNA binding protein
MDIIATNDIGNRKGFSIREVAQMLGFSQSFVRLEISRGRLRALHVGRRVIITPDALDRWLKESQ